MEESVVKERFNRLLQLVQRHSAEAAGRYVGQIKEALVESVDEQLEEYVSGRLDNNMIVHLPGTKDLIGKLVRVKLLEAKGFYYMGQIVEEV